MAATTAAATTATAAFSENKFVTSLKTDPLLRSYQVAAGRGIVCKYYSQPTILFPSWSDLICVQSLSTNTKHGEVKMEHYYSEYSLLSVLQSF